MYRASVSIFAVLVVFAMLPQAAHATRANGKAGQRILCKEKIEAKHLAKDVAKGEWKKCMEDANAYQ